MEWSRDDPSCLDAADLASMVERTLGRAVFHGDAPPFATVKGAVGKADPEGFGARVALVGADGRTLAERALSTTGPCARLDESVAVVVTLMIDGLDEAPTPLRIPPEPPRPPAPAPLAPAPSSRAFTLTLGLGPGLSASLLPGVVASFGIRTEVAVAGFVPIAATLRVHAASSAVVPGSGEGGRFTATTGEVAACPAWATGRLRLGGCAGLGSGALEGQYLDLYDGESHVRPLFFVSLLPFAALRLAGPVWARAEAGAWFPVLREGWGYLDPMGTFHEVFRPGLAVPAGALTLEVRTGP
jgi:hypothetical protein